MFIIGELVNGMYKAVAKAINERDELVIQHLAKDQVDAGAAALDVNTGPYSRDPRGDMRWLVQSIRKVVDVPLSIDSSKVEVIEEGLAIAPQRSIINSTTADEAKMAEIFGLARKYRSPVIALTMDSSGVPNDRMRRVELAAVILTKAAEFSIPAEDIYLDPILLPINVAQTQGLEVLEALREFRHLSDPAPKTVIGLSNVSQGTKTRSLINRTFLAMATAGGLSAAILDPLDRELMDAMITSELIINKQIYCDSYREAYRKKALA